MTTLEVSNLGRFGFMGGKGGTSLSSQDGAVAKIRAGRSQNEGEGGNGDEENGNGENHNHSHSHDNQFGLPTHTRRTPHNHSNGFTQVLGGAGNWLLKIVGLDLYTKGKAGEGLKRANQAGNPFDRGFVINCRGEFDSSSFDSGRLVVDTLCSLSLSRYLIIVSDFWTRGRALGVNYEELYDVSQLSSLAQSSLEDSLNSSAINTGGGRRRWSMWDGFKRGLGVRNGNDGYQLVGSAA